MYTRVNGVWQESATLRAGDVRQNHFFGVDVAVSGDTAIIGAREQQFGSDRGSAYIFTRVGGAWQQSAKFTGQGANTLFGWSVDIDGDTAVVGARELANFGRAYILSRVAGGAWQAAGGKLWKARNDGRQWADRTHLDLFRTLSKRCQITFRTTWSSSFSFR